MGGGGGGVPEEYTGPLQCLNPSMRLGHDSL